MTSTTTDVLNGVSTSTAVKAPVRVATTANITLSGTQTIDGVAVVAEDRVLVKNQTDATENGIYNVKANTWARAADFDGARDVRKGTLVLVTEGTANADIIYKCTTENPIVIGTSSIVFAESVNLAAILAAQVAAETAEENAETAQALAETAQANAETAEANAETAQAAAETAAEAAAEELPYAHISGLVPSNAAVDQANDIDFSAGSAEDSTQAYSIIAGAFRKRADATWAVGSFNGGTAEGVSWGIASIGDYHMFLLGKSTDPTAHDYIFDTSVTCANGLADTAVVAAGFDIYRRVFSVCVATDATWPLFVAQEIAGGSLDIVFKTREFQFSKDWSGTDDAAQTGLLKDIPKDIKVIADFSALFLDTSITAASVIIFTSADQTDVVPSAAFGTFLGDLVLRGTTDSQSGRFKRKTGTSGTIRYRVTGSTVDHALGVCLHGWEDARV